MRVLFTLILLAFISLPSYAAEMPFKVGQKYSDLIHLKKNGTEYQIPLPKGDWVVTAVRDGESSRSNPTAASSGTKLAQIYLANIVDAKLRGLTVFLYPYELYATG